MFPGPDWLANLYLGCFIFGLILTVVSTFFSVGHMGADVPHIDSGAGAHVDVGSGAHIDVGHADAGVGHVDAGVDVGHAHVDVGHAPHVDGHGHVGDTGKSLLMAEGEGQVRNPERPRSLSWANMPTILAAITWFGGVGYLLSQTTALLWTWVLGVAVAAGFLGGYIVYFFFAKLLWPAQTPPMNPDEYALPGTVARVVSGIAAGGTGEILYTKGGTRSVAGARSLDGSPLPKGTEVRVVRYERGLAYVTPRAAAPGAVTPDEGQVTTKLPPSPQP
jgi:hypothetical protein